MDYLNQDKECQQESLGLENSNLHYIHKLIRGYLREITLKCHKTLLLVWLIPLHHISGH